MNQRFVGSLQDVKPNDHCNQCFYVGFTVPYCIDALSNLQLIHLFHIDDKKLHFRPENFVESLFQLISMTRNEKKKKRKKEQNTKFISQDLVDS